MPTIAVVDDDHNILTSISIALEAEGFVTMTYMDGSSALDGFESNPPDLAILDIKMPRMDGIETLRRLREKSDLPVIFLTSKGEEIDELFSLKMGADDFVRKPFSRSLLLERIKAVLRRHRAVLKESEVATALEHGHLCIDPERFTCTWKNNPISLTVTEFLILQALAARPGVFKNRNSLMDAAYNDEVYVDDRTIDSHIKRLRKKFRQSDETFDMIETGPAMGAVGQPNTWHHANTSGTILMRSYCRSSIVCLARLRGAIPPRRSQMKGGQCGLCHRHHLRKR